jgi:ubiquinone/menaquinone biosynthesis C-methylase UbiE
MPNYGDILYWENRYQEQRDSTFDWIEDYQGIRGIIIDVLEKEKFSNQIKVLNVGCGNSELGEKLFLEEDYNIYINNIDISRNVIQNMKERCKEMESRMNWEIMDVRDIKYSQGYFDIVIDKCTLDTILCGKDGHLNVAIMTKEIQRVLKTSGIYILISHSGPDTRISHLNKNHLAFDISISEYRNQFPDEDNLDEKVYYVYICKKKNEADYISGEYFSSVYYELNQKETVEEESDEDK